MKPMTTKFFCATLLAAAVLLLPRAFAQEHSDRHHHYKLIDLGTFGGPASYVNEDSPALNNRGMLVGSAEINTPLPPTGNPFPCASPSFVYQAFAWEDGVLTNLGALPGGNCSNAIAVNASGDAAGNSEIGTLDPVLGFSQLRAVLWDDGQIRDLGTLGGNHSGAQAINNRRQVTGFALNGTPDPFSFFDFFFFGASGGTQTRAVLWHDGKAQDLGTLGGPDAFGIFVNDGGQVAGTSYTSSIPNPTTGVPTLDPFFWDDGKMIDLGSFGGTVGFPQALNNRGQVAGFMNLPGDVNAHPFLWHGGKLTDLGTFGGNNGTAWWMNDAGEVIGEADYPIACGAECGHPQVYRPFLWRKGVMTDLGAVPGDRCGFAYGINSRTQVVGSSGHCLGGVDAFLWERGAIYNLNDLIPANSPLHLVFGLSINDRGEIAGTGVPQGASPYDFSVAHAYLLIPCEADDDGCDGSAENATTAAPRSSVPILNRVASVTSPQRSLTPRGTAAAWRAQMLRRYHIPGGGAPKN
jgi:probable HAF family extracellular repeat protein